MKKTFLFTSIICSALILSGCQFFSEFVVVNNSEDFIEITYEAINPGYSSLTPNFVTLEEFNKNETKWRIIPKDKHKIDKEKGIVEVKLAPSEVLRIASVNAVRIQEKPYDELNLKNLKIVGKNGSIFLDGIKVFEGFKPVKKSWTVFTPSYPTYVIYYK